MKTQNLICMAHVGIRNLPFCSSDLSLQSLECSFQDRIRYRLCIDGASKKKKIKNKKSIRNISKLNKHTCLEITCL